MFSHNLEQKTLDRIIAAKIILAINRTRSAGKCHNILVSTAGGLVLLIEQHITFSFWNRLPNKTQDLSKIKISCVLIVLCHKMLVFPFLTLEQHNTFKESMINWLSNIISSNRSADIPSFI